MAVPQVPHALGCLVVVFAQVPAGRRHSAALATAKTAMGGMMHGLMYLPTSYKAAAMWEADLRAAVNSKPAFSEKDRAVTRLLISQLLMITGIPSS